MSLTPPDKIALQPIISLALQEDIGRGDITSQLLIPEGTQAEMLLNAREPMVACGLFIVPLVYEALNSPVTAQILVPEGQAVEAGTTLVKLTGPAQALLTGERVALNLIQRMCAIASVTASYVKAVQGSKAIILDTRKTMPGQRILDKYAVRAGGGQNHRMRLDDMVLIKDNHIALCGSITAAISKARTGCDLPMVVECDTLEQLKEALSAKPDRIMLDNMTNDMMSEAVRITAGAIPLEATGGVSLEGIAKIAATGVDYISIGRLTHSAASVDIGADITLEA